MYLRSSGLDCWKPDRILLLQESVSVSAFISGSLICRGFSSNRSLLNLSRLLYRSGRSFSWGRSSWLLSGRSRSLLGLSSRCFLLYKGESVLLRSVGRGRRGVDIARRLVVDNRGGVVDRGVDNGFGNDNWGGDIGFGNHNGLIGSGGNNNGFVRGRGRGNLDDRCRGNLHNRCRCYLDDRGRGGLVWGRGGDIGLSFGVGSLSLVLDISNITFGSSRVRDDLDTAVGQVDTVFAICVVVVPRLCLREDRARVLRITHSVLVIVDRGEGWVLWLSRVGGRGGRWG